MHVEMTKGLLIITMMVLLWIRAFPCNLLLSKHYSGSSNSVPENIPQVPLRIHAVPESTSSVITSSCLGFTVR